MARDAHELHDRLELALMPTAAGLSRAFAMDVLQQWGAPEPVIESALVIVSELVTNAFRHAQASPEKARLADRPVMRTCTLSMSCLTDHLVICVTDLSPHAPKVRGRDDDAETGRGLHLVQSLSSEWGYALLNPGPGKLVYARLSFGSARAVRSLCDQARAPTGLASSASG
jgi:anti-sigma regulatory factor (Ser/Thr protein kinase)